MVTRSRRGGAAEFVHGLHCQLAEMPEDNDKEIFEVVDYDNNVVGRQLRGVCHAEGIPHRAAYCFVFNVENQLLLQQRSARKKVGANQWDLSVAEHLQPGEDYCEAAVRGLGEELGIIASLSDLSEPLAAPHLRVLHIPGMVNDVEFVQAFRLNGWSGDVAIDQTEVQAVKWMAVTDIYGEVHRDPGMFTPWLRGELELLREVFLGELQTPPEAPSSRVETFSSSLPT